jgi:hypothetical protein
MADPHTDPTPTPGSAYAAYRASQDAEVLDSAEVLVDPRIRRRRRRQTVTFTVFFLIVVGLGFAAYLAYQGRIELPIGSGRPPALPTCPPAPVPTAVPYRDVSVHVFNASNRRGLALTVARDLQKRGFTVPSEPANEPSTTKVTTVALVRHGASGLLAARTLASVIAGPVTLVSDERATDDVDLVLGPTFSKLKAPVAKASAAPSAAPDAEPTCQPAPDPTTR